MNSTEKKAHREKGIAILFAILMTSVLMLVAIGITQVSYKEILFSIEARDSDLAFMAADTGIECAMYMDSMQAFATTTSDSYSCHGHQVVYSSPSGDFVNFQFSLPITARSCAEVYINKQAGTGTSTQIDSYGYNAPQKDSANCIDTSSLKPNLVSRALRITYSN